MQKPIEEHLQNFEKLGFNEGELAVVGKCFVTPGGVDNFRKILLGLDEKEGQISTQLGIEDIKNIDSDFVNNLIVSDEENKQKILESLLNNSLEPFNNSEEQIIMKFLENKTIEERVAILNEFESLNNFFDKDFAEVSNADKILAMRDVFVTTRQLYLPDDYIERQGKEGTDALKPRRYN